jgi:hypothetical protein
LELLHKDYPFEDDEEQERDALINNVYDTIQYFMSQYDFSAPNDQDDEGSPGVQPWAIMYKISTCYNKLLLTYKFVLK